MIGQQERKRKREGSALKRITRIDEKIKGQQKEKEGKRKIAKTYV